MHFTNRTKISCFVLLFGLVTVPAQSQVEKNPPTAQPAVEQTGCLSKSGDAFTLLSHETGVSFRLTEGANLEQHVGHTVTVSGTLVEGAVHPETLRVRSIKHIAASCPEPSKTSAGADAVAAKSQGLTADDQGLSEGDDEITRKIRKAVVADETLSTYAHNIKIITRSGMVTLRGPVRSEDEKRSIETKAKTVAGEAQVENDLTVTKDHENPNSKKGEQ
jgi:hypothetical protein